MVREVAHFLRHAPEMIHLQRRLSRAEFLDTLNARADAQGYGEIRRELVADLSGRVLEVGSGTGTMFSYYGPDVDLDAIEPEEDFLELAIAKVTGTPKKIRVAAGDGMHLAFEDASFDAVVLGLVLCSVPSVDRVVAEVWRVLRRGGKLRALEHVRSDGSIAGRLMDVANPLWLHLNRQGCNWNRDPIASIKRAGFEVDDVRAFQRFDTILPAFPMRRMRAHKPD
jgi:SAM-dependent methyltransferase